VKLNVQHHNLRSTHELDSLVESRILALQPRLQIDEANVRLECRLEASPAYGVRIHLVTPGTDVFAEGRDHTIRAAVKKAIAEIDSRLDHREARRRQRARSNLQAPAARARNAYAGRQKQTQAREPL
jgi:ribosome-associated translation inhibitor RaiA